MSPLKNLLCFILILKSVSSCGLKTARIMNGKNATTWPWMVSLQTFDVKESKLTRSHFCGGSLISPQYVLTAAHCFFPSREFIVKVGSNDLYEQNENQKLYEISKLFLHNEYNDKTFVNDIALIKLKEKVVLSDKVSTICLPSPSDENLVINKTITVTGWGATDGYETNYPVKLLETNMKIFDDDICGVFNDSHYCAYDDTPTQSTICAADSGGPLIFNTKGQWTLFGLTSYGKGNETISCMNDQPAFFTKVPKYIDWINGKMQNETNLTNLTNLTNGLMFKKNYLLFFILTTILGSDLLCYNNF